RPDRFHLVARGVHTEVGRDDRPSHRPRLSIANRRERRRRGLAPRHARDGARAARRQRPMSAAVQIVGAGKRFGSADALGGVDATIDAGRLTGLVGPDGAGKTTLIRMMAALMTPTSGRIVVAGHDVATDAYAVHEVTGYMPQRFGLYEDLSVIENLRLYAEL